VIDSPWSLSLLIAAVLNLSRLQVASPMITAQRPAVEEILLSYAAPYLAILAFWFAGRRWGAQSYAPAILVGLCFLPNYTTSYGTGANGDLLMLPALLIATHFGAAPQFPAELYAYRRVAPLDALVIFCLLATGVVVFQALAVNAEKTDSFGPVFVAGGGSAPMVVVMLALAVSGADRRLAFTAILFATVVSLPGLALPTASSMSPFISQSIGLSPGGALLCLTALYIDKAVPLLLRWRWEAGIKSIFSLGASIYLSQWAILIDATAYPGRQAINWFSGWSVNVDGAETTIAQPALPWVIAFAIGVAVCLRRTHVAEAPQRTELSVRAGGLSENAGYLVALAAGLAVFLNEDFVDLGDWGLLNPVLSFRVNAVFLAKTGLGPDFLAVSPTGTFLVLGFLAARRFARDNALNPQLAVWRAVRRGAEAPNRPDRPRRILLATVMGAGWVWSGPVMFGLALSMMVGSELARREIAFDPRSAIRDHGREEQLDMAARATLARSLRLEVDQGLVELFRTGNDITIRLNSPGVGPLIIPKATQTALSRLATVLKQVPGPVAVRAHTSSEPPASFWHRTNDALSDATARRVAGYLAAYLGDPTRVSAEGRSDREPIADNSTAEGADRNNRIEIVLLGPPSSKDGFQTLDELLRSVETCGALSISQRATRGGRSIRGALGSEQEVAQLKEAVEKFGERADFDGLQVLPSTTCRVRIQLTKAWRETAGPLCRATVDGRYPFDRQAEAESSLQDFTQLFAPVGEMDIFFVSNLADLVDQSEEPWQWRKGVDLGYSDNMLEQFQNAADLRDAFFADGRLSWDFEVAVEAMDPKLESSTLDIGGQKIEFSHNAAPPTKRIEWPNTGQASLSFSPEIAGAENAIVRTGAWAWFRLLDAAELRRTDAQNVRRAIFNIDDRLTIYRVRSAYDQNPVSSREALDFRCPTEL